MKLDNLGVGQKLVVSLIVTLVIGFGGAGWGLRSVGERYARETAEQYASTSNAQTLEIAETFARELELSSNRLLGALRLGFPDTFRVDKEVRVPVGDRETIALLNGTVLVNNETAWLDRFLAESKTVATFFVRDGDDFIRVATSLKKEDGSRAMGTMLEKSHPAYPRLKSGVGFHGVARLFGRDYYTRYEPIEHDGEVIGAMFVGVDLTENLAKLNERLKSIRIGETGYVFVLDGRSGSSGYGQFVVHRSLEGKSGLDLKDENGQLFIREMLEKRSGLIHYLWKSPGSGSTSKAVVKFAPVDSFGWIVATRADEAELSAGVIAMERIALVSGIFLLLALPLPIYLMVRRIVTRPLNDLQRFCSEVEGSRDLTLSLQGRGNDEVGQTISAVLRLMQSLRAAFGEILVRVDSLDAAAQHLSSTAKETAANSVRASDAASDMAASVEEMSVGISQISDSAAEAAKLSQIAGADARDGGATILQATNEMNLIADTMQGTAVAIGALGDESRHIAGIVSVIKDVADQTNLLALNAAIEAARAGESGRGFAVVADEVRKLADRTTKATDEIERVTVAIAVKAAEAVAAMDKAMSQIHEGASLASGAGSAIGGIQNGADRVVSVVRQITESLTESSSASQNMANQTEKVAHVAEESSHAAQQSLVSAEEVVRLGKEVRATVAQFRI